jgi:hypothetical protein
MHKNLQAWKMQYKTRKKDYHELKIKKRLEKEVNSYLHTMYKYTTKRLRGVAFDS